MTNRPEHGEQWSEEALRRGVDAAGIALWSWNVDTDRFKMDQRGCDLWGVVSGDNVTFAQLSEKIHPADRDRVQAAFTATRAVVGAFEIDFRTLIGNKVRWISARGRGNDEDIVNAVMMGVFLDVTARKQAEEGHELLAGEMSHRVKNLLTIASVMARITSRSSSNVEDMASQLVNRLSALGRAHDLVRPLPGHQGTAALLGDVFTVLLTPYDDGGAFAGRIRIAVPRMGIGENAATSLALVVHELATNSLKYGSLSSPDGVLNVTGSVENDRVQIVWTEHGGPRIEKIAEQQGYGSKLVRSTVEGSLGGTISYDWATTGAIVSLDIKSDCLVS